MKSLTRSAFDSPPGLRPFKPDEALKFHGRETHTAELLRRLSENRFIAVVGNSGSGKSSLVRAGLLPALYRGRLIGATSQWRICSMRPGDEPIKSLAQSLAALNVFSGDEAAVRREVGRSSRCTIKFACAFEGGAPVPRRVAQARFQKPRRHAAT